MFVLVLVEKTVDVRKCSGEPDRRVAWTVTLWLVLQIPDTNSITSRLSGGTVKMETSIVFVMDAVCWKGSQPWGATGRTSAGFCGELMTLTSDVGTVAQPTVSEARARSATSVGRIC